MKTQIDNLRKYTLRRKTDGAGRKEVEFLDNMRKCIVEYYNTAVQNQNSAANSDKYKNILRLFGIDDFLVKKFDSYSEGFLKRLVTQGYELTPVKFHRMEFLWDEHHGEVLECVKNLRDFEYWFAKFGEDPNEINADMCAMLEADKPILQTPSLYRVSQMYSDKQLALIIDSRLINQSFLSWASC